MSEALSLLHHRAVARYGDLGLSGSDFYARVLEVQMRSDRSAAAPIHSEDLYLATACAAGFERAWMVLDAEYRSSVVCWCRALLRPGYQAQDLADIVWTSLFLPGRNGHPRIGSYEGICALGTWLHTITGRRAINYWNQVSYLREEAQLPVDIGDSSLLEQIEAYRNRQRLAPPLTRSLHAVCGALDETESRLLVWRFDQDIPLGEIAHRLGVHQSTVTRRLDRLCGRIRRQVVRRLAGEFRLDPGVVAECVSFARSGGLAGLELFTVIRRTAQKSQNKANEYYGLREVQFPGEISPIVVRQG
jgi:RNA polymerase sigma factor (sigma-70 family)